jgi:SpoVK/Ycf46/Vps4 family AAA+-type ATPase
MSVVQSGDKFTFADVTGTHDTLPQGNYLLKRDPREGYYLNKKEPFILPKKIYGDHRVTERWLKSWRENSTKNMGIIVTGVKGSGKTITAQKFCIDSQLPVIIINEQFHESDFIDFITNPKMGEAIVFIDEFEKIFPKPDEQFELLSIMDGSYSTRLIFLFTVNEERINDYMVNRLNRIKYKKSYGDLEYETIEEVIDDMLVNKSHKKSIYDFFDKVNMRTFDLLTNLIKEMNLFDEDAITCGNHLNLKSETKTYEVFEIVDNKEYPCYSTRYSPGFEEIEISRKELNYLPYQIEISKEDADFEKDMIDIGIKDEKLSKSEIEEYYNWNIDLILSECEIERKGKNIIFTHSKTGLKFRLKEESKYNYIF